MEKAFERFLRYIKYDTTSDHTSQNVPSTYSQLEFAHMLAQELRDMGAERVNVSEYGYVTAAIPASKDCSTKTTLGFIAHMDTTDEMPGGNIKAKIIENYDGSNIILNEKLGIVMKVSEFDSLKNYMGQTLITTDGTTLLGADDKAGVAEIMTMAQRMLTGNAPSHGEIKIGFTPDEEIGSGAEYFDVASFGADFAYTVDGGAFGEIEYENFNASTACVNIKGVSIHPGDAKNKMINSILLANEFVNMLDIAKTPQHTEGYEGFWHLNEISGGIENTSMIFILRDHDASKLTALQKRFEAIANYLNSKYEMNLAEVSFEESYKNMKQIIEDNFHLIKNACKALEIMGEEPIIIPIRGGTDGARLSYMGLPCPNLGTGGHNFHGRYEYITTQAMDKTVDLLLNIASLYARQGSPNE